MLVFLQGCALAMITCREDDAEDELWTQPLLFVYVLPTARMHYAR